MPFDSEKTALAWTNLTYKVTVNLIDEKIILNDLNGSVRFGAITALMGPSGAGKTTLLNCLNGKLSSGLDSESKIFVSNSTKIKPSFVGQFSKEQLIMCLTVEQNLIYSSKLKNSVLESNNNVVDHKTNVKDIMNELMIYDIRDNPVESCSGGQQKRLTIAVEMTCMEKPNVLCIDEPTTGLDSNVSESVMNCLQRLSESYSIAVIASIHQPNNEIVMMFDKIYVMAKGGHCLYSGSPDHIDSSLRLCDIICNEEQVPIEQLLKLSSMDRNEYIDQLIFKTKEAIKSEVQKIESYVKTKDTGIKSKAFRLKDIWFIMCRTVAQLYASQWKALLIQLLFYILIPFTTSSMFKEGIGRPGGCFDPNQSNISCAEEVENDSDLHYNQFFIFFTTIIAQFLYLCYTTVVYIGEAKIFVNEYNNGWYSTASYFLAKSSIEIIPTIIYSIVFSYLSFTWSGQFYEDHRLIIFISVFTLSFICTEGVGHTIGIVFSDYPRIAMIMSIGLYAIMALFCNFFIKVQDMPQVMQYVSPLAYPKYAFEAMILLVYGLNRCSPGEQSVILIKFQLKDQDLPSIIYSLAIYAFVLRIFEYMALYLKNNLKVTFSLSIISKLLRIRSNRKLRSYRDSIDVSVMMNMRSMRRESLFIRKFGDECDENTEKFMHQNVICIGWTDLTMKIPKNLFTEEKVILNRINGCFEFSSLNALMGSSGAGKTSLLKAINGLSANRLSYEINIYLSRYKRIKSCFVSQDQRDHLMTGITAGEAMLFASKLKNLDNEFDHKKNVEKLMKELLIFNAFNTNVEKCSGGEQKRLVIAMELTDDKKPNLLCIDEPTSGLDSYSAEVLMLCLKRLAERHQICIITSIHQPSSDILKLFTKIYVLAKGGHCIYSDRPQEISQYLDDCDVVIGKHQLPIETMLRYSCNGIIDPTVSLMIQKTSRIETNLNISRVLNETNLMVDGLKVMSKRFLLKDLKILIQRKVTNILRYDWRIIGAQFAVYIIFGFVLIWTYGTDIKLPSGCVNLENEDLNNSCAKTEEKLREEQLLVYNINYNFYAITLIIFFSSILPTLTFAAELQVFLNEHRNGWYSTGSYYWCQSLIEVLPVVITLLFYCLVINIYEYSMYYWFLILLTIGTLNVQTLAQIISIIFSDNQRLAVFTSVGLFIFGFLFSNFTIPTKDLHYFLKIVSDFSILKLILENILLLHYGFDRCNDNELSTVLYMHGIDDQLLYPNLRLLMIQFIVFRFTSMLILLLKLNPLMTRKSEQQKISNIIEAIKKRKASKVLIPGLIPDRDLQTYSV